MSIILEWVSQTGKLGVDKQAYKKGDTIFVEQDDANSFLVIEQGNVKHIPSPIFGNNKVNQKLGGEPVYQTFINGDCIDFECFFLKEKRRFNAVAETDVIGFMVTRAIWENLKKIDLNSILEFQNIMMAHVISSNNSYRETNIKEFFEQSSNPSIDLTVEEAVKAQLSLIDKSDLELDKIIQNLSDVTKQSIDIFAKKEVEQTGIGNITHKKHKLSIVCVEVLQQLLGIKTIGKIDTDVANNVVEYADPLGVIFAVCPLTNPIPNSLFTILNSIKTRNSVIISYPHKSVALGEEFVNLMRSTLSSHGLPENLIQTVPQPSSRINTCKFMAHSGVDRVLATGGSSLVKAAYSSGTPCLGVGPGNAPSLIYADADLPRAAASIVQSKTYDNGIICGSENNLLVEESVTKDFLQELVRARAAILNDCECNTILDLCFDDKGNLTREMMGLSASDIASRAGIKRDYEITLFILKCDKRNTKLAQEKLGPFLTLFSLKAGEILPFAKNLLLFGGAGHTASIFTNNAELIDKFATTLPAGRLLVNTPATFGMMGVSTNLPTSFMLGSGSWGKNLTTDAVIWRDFLNIKRLAYHAHEVNVNP